MITIKNAWVRNGYSKLDHFELPIDDVAGLRFKSVGAARASIWSSPIKSGSNVTLSPIGLIVLFEDVETREIGLSVTVENGETREF